jgi:general secretion pathway protein I
MNREIGPRRASGRPCSGERTAGFTLIEVVVAFVLLSTVLTLGFEIFSDGMRRTGDLQDRSRAVVIAQSKLDAVGMEQPLADGVTSGESEDRHYRWTLSIARSEETESAPGQPINSAYALFRVEARVEWDGGDGRARSYSLATLRLGPRPT